MKGHRILMLSLCGCVLVLMSVLPPVHLPPTLANAPLLAEAPTSNSNVYLPVMLNRYNPWDVPIYRNSFEAVTDLAANGISSNANISITSENVDFASGNKALEVYGTLPGAQWSYLTADFSMQKLIGVDTLDLSDKTIGYSAFIPNDSPINGGIGVWAIKGDIVVVLSGNSGVHGEWVDAQFDVADIYKNKSWAYTNGTDDEARDAIQHCETISITGGRSTAGTAADTNFYVDNLNWIRSDRFNLPIDNDIDSLRKVAADKHFDFGLYAAPNLIFGPENDPWNWKGDPWYAYMAAQEGAITTVVEFSPKANEDYNNFDYDRPEDAALIRQYNFGEAYHMTILGYGIGCWHGHNGVPQWIRDLAFPDATQALLLYHTEKDLRYTQGKHPVWILSNEFILDLDGAGLRNRQGRLDWGQYSPWAANTTDSSLYKAAFIKAREVDPDATLMLNDWDVEDIGWVKSEYLYQLVSDLKTEGTPIDGVGFQMHNFIDPNGKLVVFREVLPYTYTNTQRIDLDTYLENVDLNVKRYASIGMKVAFTEVEGQIKIDDIDFTTTAGRAEYEKRLQYQADYFSGLLSIALENENVIVFHMWGGTDKWQGYQIWPGYGNGFIFDKNYNPKPAYDAMLELLKGP